LSDFTKTPKEASPGRANQPKRLLRVMHAIGLRIEVLSIKAQPFAQVVDTEPRNSLACKRAAGGLAPHR
jgi:hypothetical protein